MQNLKRLALGAGAEILTGALLSSVSLPTLGAAISSVAGIPVTAGFAASAVVWALAGTMLANNSPRLLSLTNSSVNTAARAAGRAVGGLQSGLRIFSLLMAGDKAKANLPPNQRSIASRNHIDPLRKASQVAAAGNTALVSVISTDSEYRDFVASIRSKGVPVIDLDTEAAQRKRDAKLPFAHSAEALGEITRLADQNGRITPDEADDILDRMRKSKTLDPENRRDLLSYLATQMVTYERETADDRELLETARANTEPAILQIDANITERLKNNDQISRALHDAAIISDVDEVLGRVRQSIELVGFDKTLELVRTDPARFGEIDRPRGIFERPGSSIALDNQYLKKHTDSVEKISAYVENLKSNSADAEQARNLRELRDRQSELDARVNERDRALERIKKRIERETLWIEPDTRREILRDSLEKMLHSREPDLKKAEKQVVFEASRDIAEEKQSSKNIVDISKLLDDRKDRAKENEKTIATERRGFGFDVDGHLMKAAFKLDGATLQVPLYKRDYQIKMMTTALSDEISNAPQDKSVSNKKSISREATGIGR